MNEYCNFYQLSEQAQTLSLIFASVNILKHLPNAITCANLFCGCLAMLSTLSGQVHHATFYIAAALVFDFLDGFVARLLNVQSPLGKQLDSLADMVTFGVVPGIILFSLFLKSNFFLLIDNRLLFNVCRYFFFIITIASALRLAKFNIDTRQTNSFLGLPTPATTIFIASLPLIAMHDQYGLVPYILNPLILFGICLLFSVLMTSEIPLFALKFKNFKWVDNKPQFLLIGLSIILLLVLKLVAIPAIIVLYILLSILCKKQFAT